MILIYAVFFLYGVWCLATILDLRETIRLDRKKIEMDLLEIRRLNGLNHMLNQKLHEANAAIQNGMKAVDRVNKRLDEMSNNFNTNN